ncbi:hypothetical protein D3C72_2398170 [compost metagenome]
MTGFMGRGPKTFRLQGCIGDLHDRFIRRVKTRFIAEQSDTGVMSITRSGGE